MLSLSIDDLRPDHVVAQPVTTSQGLVLCPRGYRLTEATINRLRRTKVEHVVVEGDDPEGLSPDKRFEQLEQRFAGIEDPILLQIKAAVQTYLSGAAERRAMADRG